MADYKAMYLAAMDAMERAIEALTEAQQKCEDLYVETCGEHILRWPENVPCRRDTDEYRESRHWAALFYSFTSVTFSSAGRTAGG